ncbi:MAG: hypothetical protein HY736_21580 [Verrucomicrobia bacterium]|nr:hypothetical protein [Verrucomicrobiota bacterium]
MKSSCGVSGEGADMPWVAKTFGRVPRLTTLAAVAAEAGVSRDEFDAIDAEVSPCSVLRRGTSVLADDGRP